MIGNSTASVTSIEWHDSDPAGQHGCPARLPAADFAASLASVIAWMVMWSGGLAGSARATVTFTNVAAASGLTHIQNATPGSEPMTGGAAAGDFDGDGLVDLFFTRVDGPDVLYRNTGTGFVDISSTSGFTQTLPTSGVASGDIDNDGDLDLYVTASSHNRFYLYINDGTGHFSEQAVARGAAVLASDSGTWRGMGVAMGDYDRDGYLDILTSDHSRSMTSNGSRLLRNLGGTNPGTFEDVTHAVGLDVYRQAINVPNTVYRFQPQFTDLDRDGHTDILFSADDRTSQLFWNNGDGTFTDGTLPAGVGTDKSGMGNVLGDYDGDGDLDWFVTAIFDTPFLGVNPGNRLYRNNGNRTFTDVTTATGVRNSGTGSEVSWGWGTVFFDYDNDADLDLAMTNGWPNLGYTGDHSTLRRNNGDGTFTDVTSSARITDTGQGRGLLHLDFDNDGDQDLLIVNYGATPILYRNDGENEGHWLKVKTQGTLSNRDGIGALVTVVPDLTVPDEFQIREIRSGDSYLTQNEMTAHFGLGGFTEAIDQLTIQWPSGIVQQIHGVAPDSLLLVREAFPGDFNFDLTVNDSDMTVWNAEFGLSAPGLQADANFNGIVEGKDFLLMQKQFGSSLAQRTRFMTTPEPGTFAASILAAILWAWKRMIARNSSHSGGKKRICACAPIDRGTANAPPPVPRLRRFLREVRGHGDMHCALVIRSQSAHSPVRRGGCWLLGLAWVALLTPARAVDVWITTGSKSHLLSQQADVVFRPGVGSGDTPISVVPAQTFQTVSGFGAALTDSSAWLLENELTTDQREKLMRQLFSRTSGIGLNYLRVPLGASDFTASGFYTYNDNPVGGTDELQSQFSISHDQAYIIPRLQEALALNADLKLMGSPWSAPGWMKTNGSLIGSGASLKTQWEESYALYLTKIVQAYAAEGLPMDTLTLQNEPLHTANYPSMHMSATQQTNIIKNHLGPMFAAEGIDTKIVAYDHNWDNIAYPLQLLSDPTANSYVAGTAFHAYGGSVTAQSSVHNQFPDKDIYFTEISGGDWAAKFDDNLVWYFQNILNGSVRNWAKTAIMWNLALDQNDGPHLNGCGNCRGVVTISTTDGSVTFNEEFYALGQVTKAVQANATRILATTYSGGIDTAAYTNPDGSRALVALNPSNAATTIRVVSEGEHFSYQIPGRSVATFLWDQQGADFDNGGFEEGGYQTGGGSLDAWNVFGSNIGNVSVANQVVRGGEKSLKLYGQFNGQPNTSGVSQGITVSTGDYVQVSLSTFVRSQDSIAGTANWAEMKIEFYGTYGAAYGSADFLGEFQATIADESTTNDVWLHRELAGVAPAGAVEGRLVLQFHQPSGQSGAVHLDNVDFRVGDAADFDDDGDVDHDDLMVWGASYGVSAAGDADGDGDTDGSDFLIWQRTRTISHTATPADFAVPEVRSWAMMAMALVTLLMINSRTCGPTCGS
jgi:glucosylceramidase